MKIMFLFPICLVIGTLFVFAQPGVSATGATAPVNWQRYRDKEQDVSILFPKMPTAQLSSDGCSEINTSSYYAFADGAVYSMTVYARKQTKYPCTRITVFDRKLLLDRLAKLHGTTADDPDVVAAAEDGRETKFNSDQGSIWVLSQISKNRWIEMAIVHRKDGRTNEKEFVDSLELKSNEGAPIGNGASATLGDPDSGPADAPTDPATRPVVDPFMIIMKPRASYTDSARQAKIQGVVRLHVELLRNGSIGKIDVLSSLKYGLTEQAIAAAKRIVFLPRQFDGVRVNSSATFEYSFSIY